jgi:hypothetical protein
MWTIQIMSELGERDELSLAHLPSGLSHESALFGGEYVIGIDHTPGLDEHAILGLSDATKSPSLTLRVSSISRGMTTWRRWPTRPIRSGVVDFIPMPFQII